MPLPALLIPIALAALKAGAATAATAAAAKGMNALMGEGGEQAAQAGAQTFGQSLGNMNGQLANKNAEMKTATQSQQASTVQPVQTATNPQQDEMKRGLLSRFMGNRFGNQLGYSNAGGFV